MGEISKRFSNISTSHFWSNVEENIPNWPLMEEEILVVEDESHVYFNFPHSLYKKTIEKHVAKLSPIVRVKDDPLGGKRVVLTLDKQGGLEVKAWLSLMMDKLGKKYFITELEIV